MAKKNFRGVLDELMQTAGLDHYLDTLGMLKDYVNTNSSDLSNHHVIFIHHFTNETLATLCAFDRMNVSKVDTLWVKYFGSIPLGYMNTIMALPLAVYRFYGLQPVDASDYNSGYLVSDSFSPLNGFERLVEQTRANPLGFLESMQLVAMHLFLDAIVDADGNNKVIIAEDGGYLAPLVNSLSLKRVTLAKVCELYHYSNEKIPAASMNEAFADWISKSYVGSVEHTRNGYDSLMDVEKLHGRLAYPACTLAISKYKVFDESIEVAYSCINAIENILNGQGFVFNYRKCLVLGSLGAIGIQSMHALAHRLGNDKVAGIDIAFEPGKEYDWRQYAHPADLPEDVKHDFDFIFGVIGRSVLDASYFEDLVLNTTSRNVFLASGSTKQLEFADFIRWSEGLLAAGDPRVGGHPVRIRSEVFDDPQTSTVLGTRLDLVLTLLDGEKYLTFYLLSQLMPVNFQYYGVARETMDRVMTDFVALVKLVSQLPDKKLPARVLPLENLLEVPDHVSNEMATLVEPLAAGFEILEQLDIRPHHDVLIVGDGKLGLLINHAISTSGASVTHVGRHADKLNMLEPLGGKTVLLDAGTDFLGRQYDIVVEATGSISGFRFSVRHTKPRGILVLKSTLASDQQIDLSSVVVNEITIVGSRCGLFRPALEYLAGEVDLMPLISATYPADKAIEAVEHSKRKGTLKVLIDFMA